MNVLHLTLHRKWFDKIAKGIKKHEYREVKPYWTKRITDRQYDEIHFRNGYQKNAPFMRVQYLGYKIKGCLYALKLGAILEIKNY